MTAPRSEPAPAGARSGRWDLVGLLPAAICLGPFFLVYVPLLPAFLGVLAPLLALIAAVTAFDRRKGLFLFILLFPLIGHLPYHFGIDEHVPHAPAALILFLAFFLGSLANGVLVEAGPERRTSFGRLVRWTGILVVFSGIITVARYADFVPFASGAFHDLVVNVQGVRAGGAVMSGLFSSLFHLSGLLFFTILSKTLRSRDDVRKAAGILAISLTVSLAFAAIQAGGSMKLGNTAFWTEHNQINGTFSDPNAFGAVLSAAFPLLLGLSLTAGRKGLRIMAGGAGILALAVFPSIGSRSAFAALAAGMTLFALFRVSRMENSPARKLLLGSAAVICIVLILGGLLLIRGPSKLKSRLTFDGTAAGTDYDRAGFFNMRLRLWTEALRMMKDYPLTGVGIGAFIVEYPNYVMKAGGTNETFTDSALNLFFQTGAELGGAGILLILLLAAGILRRLTRILAGGEGETRPLIQGAGAGIAAFLVNFQFHTYVGNPEVIYFFWLLVAMVSMAARPAAGEAVSRPDRRFRVFVPALFLLFAGVHAWNSGTSLSIASETEAYGWSQDYGFYQAERDESGRPFRWMKRQAGFTLQVRGKVVSLTMLASHPGLDRRPVRTRIFLADRHFRKTRLLTEVVLGRNSWLSADIAIPSGAGDRIRLVFETDREWRPRGDPRSLAVALRPPMFRS